MTRKLLSFSVYRDSPYGGQLWTVYSVRQAPADGPLKMTGIGLAMGRMRYCLMFRPDYSHETVAERLRQKAREREYIRAKRLESRRALWPFK